MLAASSITEIVYFGDSLTDSGEFFALADAVLVNPFPSAEFDYDGQFSNGDVYSDIAPDLLGVSSQNFAVGGARAIGVRTADFLTDPGGIFGVFGDVTASQETLDEVSAFDINLGVTLDAAPDPVIGGQIGRYLSTLEGPAAPGTVASIFIGLNDLNAFSPTEDGNVLLEFSELAGVALRSTFVATQTLLEFGGVEKVFINTLPPASFFPSFQFAPPELQAIGDLAFATYNANLIDAAAGFGDLVEVIRFDAIAGEILDDPSAFGFLAFDQARFFGTGADPQIILNDGVPEGFFAENPALEGLDIDQIAFQDFLHFATDLHGVFGVFSAAQIEDKLTILGNMPDTVTFNQQDDLVLAGEGGDFLRTRNGDDTVITGLGDNIIRAGSGDDIVVASNGEDDILGGAGDDILGGGSGDDLLRGSSGNDILIDGLGSDIAIGGSGNDSFFYTEASLIGGGGPIDIDDPIFEVQEVDEDPIREIGFDNDLFRGGSGEDTLFLVLTEETRAQVESELVESNIQNFESIGLRTVSVENFVFLDSRADFAELDLDGRLNEADLWGIV